MKAEFQKVLEDIYLLKTPAGGVWSGIILVDGPEKILVDSGESGEQIDSLLVPALEKLGYRMTDIAWLLNTHCHGDHVGGHCRAKELSGAKTAVYEKSLEKIRDPLRYSKRIRAVYPENSPKAPKGLRGVEADRTLKEGDLVGGRLSLIGTPGHDDDCVCFLDLPTKTLISGDSLQGNGTLTQGTALYMDLEDYRDSLSKLEGMDIENIISAHPYLYSGESAFGKGKVREYLGKCREITRIYGDYIEWEAKMGILDPVVLAKGLIQYMGNQMPAYLFLALYTVDTHLRSLGYSRERSGGNR